MTQPSRIFVGYRALGFTSNEVPFCIRYMARHDKLYIITCVGRAFHTYQADKLAIVRVSNRLTDEIRCMAVDDSFVFVGSGKDVYAFVRGRQVEFTYRGHLADVHLLLPFASHLVSVDTSCCVKIWAIRKQEEYAQLQFNKASFDISALVHPQGIKNVVLFGSRQGSLQLWNINTSKLLFTFAGWDSSVTALEQSPEEKVIAIGLADGRTIIHNIVYDQTVLSVKQDWGEVTAISFRTDGEHLMCTGSSVGHIAVWDLEKRKLHSQIRSAHNAAVTGLRFLPSQPLLVTSSADNSLKVWIFDQTDGSGRILHERNGHSEPPVKVLFHGNDGKTILSAGEDSTVRCFSTVHDSYNKSLGRASYDKKKTKKTGLKLDEHRMPAITDFVSEAARQSDWDGIVACHRGECVATTWNFNRSTMGAHRFQHPRFKTDLRLRHTTATCVDVSSCGNYCVIGYSSGHVDLFNMQSGQHRGHYGVHSGKRDQISETDSTAHDGAVLGVNIDGINEFTVTSGTDSFVRFWRFKSRKLVNSVEMNAIISKSVIHRDSSMLALALDNFQISIVDIDTQRVVRMFAGHNNTITGMTFSADGRWLITSAMDATIKTWDLPSGKLVDCFLVDIPVKSLMLSPTGMYLATVHVGDLGVYLWSNMTMFGSAILTPLPADYEPTLLQLPSTDDQSKGERQSDEDRQDTPEIEKSERISSDLVTFSMLPQSRWKNLLNLDVIRERNKPKDAPRKPKSAPFFLPIVAGLAPKFQVPQEDEGVDSKAKSKLMTGSVNLLSEFGQLLKNTQTSDNYDSVLNHLLTMGPSATEVELSLLAPSDVQCSVDLMLCFITFLGHMFTTKKNLDLAASYLGLFMKLHGELMSTNETLSEHLLELEQLQDEACRDLHRQTNRIICLNEYLRGVTL